MVASPTETKLHSLFCPGCSKQLARAGGIEKGEVEVKCLKCRETFRFTERGGKLSAIKVQERPV